MPGGIVLEYGRRQGRRSLLAGSGWFAERPGSARIRPGN